MKIGYARVSTEDQNLDLQIDALKRFGCEKIYEDRASGADCNRQGYQAALAALKTDDTLVVWRLDRLARSMRELVDTIELLHEHQIGFHSICEYIDISSAFGELILHILSAIAHFERRLISERTRAGMKAAKARGVKFGRRLKLDDHHKIQAQCMLSAGESVSQTARQIGVSRSTLYRHLAD